MAFLARPGCRLHYHLDGPPDLPLLILGNSLGTDLHMWHRQVEALIRHFRVLRFDSRGHGASDVPAGDYSMKELAADVLALADHVGAARFAFCGLSLGAMMGQWLAIHEGGRLDAVVLSNAAAYLPSHESWSARMALARASGMSALIDAVMPRFFSQPYRDRSDPFYHSVRTTFAATDPQGYAGCCAAIRDVDFRARLGDIRVPTLVIGGKLDSATPPDIFAAELARGISGARRLDLDAGHIANIEQAASFSEALIEFLRSPPIHQEQQP